MTQNLSDLFSLKIPSGSCKNALRYNDVKNWEDLLDAKTLLGVVDTLHSIAIKNPEYKRAYQAGCMKTLKEQVEILIAQQHTDFYKLGQ